MVRVILWLQLLLVVLILRQSAAVSDQCSQMQEEIFRVRKLNHRNELLVDQCYEQLKRETHVSEAAFRSMKLAEDEFKSKRQRSETDINGLKKELDEQKIKLRALETVINDLRNEVNAKEEVLKSNNLTLTQLQTTIDDVTNELKSLNQTVKRLFEKPQHICRYLLEAAKSGDVNTAKILFKFSNDNCSDDDAYLYTPLIYAAKYGHVELVQVLLEGGANGDRVDADQDTALHLAALNGHLDVCSLLLDWGAKVDPLDRWKESPLHWAAWNGHLSVVKMFVERGADVSVKDDQGQTASDVARRFGHKVVAEWLDSVRRR